MPEPTHRVLSFEVEGVLQPKPLRRDADSLCWAPVLLNLLAFEENLTLLCHAQGLSQPEFDAMQRWFGPRLRAWVRDDQGPHAAVRAWVDKHAPEASWHMLDCDRSRFPRGAEWHLLICAPHLGVNDNDILSAIRAWLVWSGWRPPEGP
jgi:hypothetical protein